MTPEEKFAIKSGAHWLNNLADTHGKDAVAEANALDAWDWSPSEIALAILETAFPLDVRREAKFTISCWPWEKKAILAAAKPNKVEDWIRRALIEKALSGDAD